MLSGLSGRVLSHFAWVTLEHAVAALLDRAHLAWGHIGRASVSGIEVWLVVTGHVVES